MRTIKVEAIRLGGANQEEKETVITHIFCDNGCREFKMEYLSSAKKVSYVGKCIDRGDVFLIYWDNGVYSFAKGHLNNSIITLK